MKDVVLVGLGGGLGALARWKLGGWALRHTVDWKFPFSTFVVNVLGCAIAGVLAGLVVKYEWFGPATRLFLFAGLLGGFTTFSAFGLDTVTLLRRGEFAAALAYVSLSVIGALAALWIGMSAVGRPRGEG